jgi:hypothetical protein
LLCQSY